MTVFTNTWDVSFEAIPPDSQSASQGALRIRNHKEAVRERLEVDHSWAGDTDDGAHKQVTFVDPLGSKPTQANDETYIYSKDVSAKAELFFEDEDGDEVQLTKAGKLNPADIIPVGTCMLFYQASPPTGWTEAGSLSDHAIKVVTNASGNGGAAGGSSNFSTVFAVNGTGNTTLTAAQSGLPAHTHNSFDGTHSVVSSDSAHLTTSNQSPDFSAFGAVTGGAANAASPHNHALDLRVRYAQIIICDKD